MLNTFKRIPSASLQGQTILWHTHRLDTFWETLSTSAVGQEMPGHAHILDTFWKSPVSQSNLARNFRTLTCWTHLRGIVSQSSLAGNAMTHSQTGHILKEHCQSTFGKKFQNTHFLDIFWKGTIRQFNLTGISGHTHRLYTFWEGTVSNSSWAESHRTLTDWTDFESQPIQLNKKFQNTHLLDTFWEGTVSQGSLAGNAKTHSQAWHILQGLCQSVQFSKKFQNTLTCWTHLRGSYQPVHFGRKFQNTLTYWTHWERALSASPVWQKIT